MTVKQLIGKRKWFGGRGSFKPRYSYREDERPRTRITPPQFRCMIQHRDGRLVLVEFDNRQEFDQHRAECEQRHKIKITVRYL